MRNALKTVGVVVVAASAVAGAGFAVAGPAEDDFQARATASGVVRAVSFDTATEVNTLAFPDGRFQSSGSGFDSAQKASGAGSVRFTVPAQTGANTSGSVRVNFSDALNVQFGENSEFYVQWRQRFDQPMLSNSYTGGDGWKTIIIGEGDTQIVNGNEVGSCTELELVSFNGYHAGFPRLYHSCSAYAGFYEVAPNADFKLQNAMPAPYCLYSNSAGCFKYVANEWMTFQMHVKLGPRGTANSTLENKSVTGFTNSTVEMWMAREGQPSKQIINWPGAVLRETAGKKYGKVWLVPYNTNKNASATFPVANMWYDELIISRNKIADPGVTVVRPNPPTNVRAQ